MKKYITNQNINKTVLLIAFIAINSLLFSTGQWIVPVDGEQGDAFGGSIDNSGNYLIAGSKWDDIDNHINAGSANIFFNNGNEWIFDQKITAMIENNNDEFGYDVKINNDYLIVGTPYCDHDGKTDAGSAYIFKRNASNDWEQQEYLTYYQQQHEEHFGKAVAISDDYAIVGAPENNYNYNPDYYDHGRVYFFQRSGNDWVFTTCGYAEDLLPSDYFGRDISLSGNYAVIAAESGAYIFKQNNDCFSRQTNLISEPVIATSISGNYVVLSAKDPIHIYYHVYVYERDQDTDTWSQVAELLTSEGGSGFGTYGVSIKGDDIYVGANYETFYYHKPSSGWTDMNESYKISFSQYASSVSINNMLTFTGSASYGTAGGVYIEELVQNIVSGNVSLNGGEGDIEDVLITFDPISGSNIEVIPNSDGSFSHTFWADDFGTYDVTYELFSSNVDYYPITIENVVIYETTAPLTLDPIELHPINDPTNVIVFSNVNIPAFRNIQEAVSYFIRYGRDGTIHVLPGVYNGNANWNTDISHIKLSGSNQETCIIEGSFTVEGTNSNENDVIENLTFRNTSYAIINNDNGIRIVRNNKFENCSEFIVLNLDIGGLSNGTFDLINNEFINNNCFSCYYSALDNEFPANFNNVISDNIFEDNTTLHPLLWINGHGQLEIIANTIRNNSYALNGNVSKGSILEIDTSPDEITTCYIKENIFQNNTDMNSLTNGVVSIRNDPADGYYVIYNNSFIENNVSSMINYDANAPSSFINNSIFLSNNVANNVINGENIPCDYSLFYENNANNGNCNFGNNIFEVDPLLDENNQPLWNSTTKSPCIDIGYGTDPDGTPADIGAVFAVIHRYDEISLPSPSVDNGWKWLSFPALDDVYADADIAHYLLADILDPAILDKVETEGHDFDIGFIDPGWSHEYQQFYSTQGFKFHMNEEATLYVPGFLEDPTTTINLEGNQEENWIGYFLEDSHDVEVAFASIWDDLYFIWTQDWGMIKLQGVWYYHNPEDAVLEYGDMVIVKCDNPHTFQWCDDGPIKPKNSIPQPDYFSYTEKADYTPIYLEFDPDDIPTEVGAFLDGECKGAAVVEDSTTQIRIYLDDGEQGEIELVFYYNNRSENKIFESYNCMTSDNLDIVMKQLSANDKADAWLVSFREESNVVPVPGKVTLSNYPNPFNPATTISYSLPLEGNVSLCIYNVKGQLVRQLIDGSQSEGYYNVVWNGKNNTDRSVASGIYYYQIKACGKIINKKMLMLK